MAGGGRPIPPIMSKQDKSTDTTDKMPNDTTRWRMSAKLTSKIFFNILIGWMGGQRVVVVRKEREKDSARLAKERLKCRMLTNPTSFNDVPRTTMARLFNHDQWRWQRSHISSIWHSFYRNQNHPPNVLVTSTVEVLVQ